MYLQDQEKIVSVSNVQQMFPVTKLSILSFYKKMCTCKRNTLSPLSLYYVVVDGIII